MQGKRFILLAAAVLGATLLCSWAVAQDEPKHKVGYKDTPMLPEGAGTFTTVTGHCPR